MLATATLWLVSWYQAAVGSSRSSAPCKGPEAQNLLEKAGEKPAEKKGVAEGLKASL